MFVVPAFRIPWSWGVGAFLAGFLILSYPLVRSSTLVRKGDTVFLQRSGTFVPVLLGLLILRLVLHEYVEHLLPTGPTAGLFFVLAFGMIVRWRGSMLLEYRALAENR